MNDSRDPIDVYNSILEQKTAWNCSIVEAADRVEKQRMNAAAERLSGWPVPQMRPLTYPDYSPPQNGSERDSGASQHDN
jgi:hypothetical protein